MSITTTNSYATLVIYNQKINSLIKTLWTIINLYLYHIYFPNLNSPDLSLSHMDAVVAREVTPLLHSCRQMLSLASSLAVFLLCLRLLCRSVASTTRHYLLLTGHLPRVRVYQQEEATHTLNRSTIASQLMQRSQSWVDSCESGVYVGEDVVNEAHKEDNVIR